ncbi:hypothetical protein RBG61_01620 [Paludicola sp. MB14-C6]|uniref:hypothetical protein n=1 Tax=Paludihabitans sp. MB14-C6 TaxID=3070656 RepID=UPI0027DB3B96|nr:hypothetical protein [Paludicola sp. MB14-C6]WMJ23389.1 hypothetical protein RBG61_01620 [Paludicola sp. MB14-C6]
MKKKIAIAITSAILLVLIAIGVLEAQRYHIAIEPVKVPDISVTYQSVDTQFYYQQLTQEEKEIYEKIKQLLDQHKGGEIVLKQPINARSYYHIESALRYDSITYWYIAYLLPFNSSNTRVLPHLEQHSEEKMIEKMLLLIDSDKFQKEVLPASEDDAAKIKENKTVDTYQIAKDFIDYQMDDLESYYEEVNQKINVNLQQIINEMPKNCNQEEAVQYFSQWIVDHMVYEPTIEKFLTTKDIVGYDLRKEISAGSITSVNDRKGTCTGFSCILKNLCNRVGIDAYIVLGDTPNGRHGWVAIKIGDKTYYKDPTAEIGIKKVNPLQTNVQFYQYFNNAYKPFTDLFGY